MARTRNWKLILSESRDPELYKMDGGHAGLVKLDS
jgi:hypothetical protein